MPVGLDVEAVDDWRGVPTVIKAVSAFYDIGVGVTHGLNVLDGMFDCA